MAEQGTRRRRLREAAASLYRSACCARCRASTGRAASELETIEGLPPNLLAPPARLPLRAALSGAPGRLRSDRCRSSKVEPGHCSACLRARELASVGPQALGLVSPSSRNRRRPSASTDETPLLARRRAQDVVRGRRRRLIGGAPSPTVRAVDDVSFDVCAPARRWAWSASPAAARRRSGRTLLRLETRSAGRIVYDGRRHHPCRRGTDEALPALQIQVIFQDPYSSLNPRMTIGQIIAEPMLVHGLVPDRARPPGAGAGPARAGRAVRLHGRALSARALRRPAPARRHRARAGDGAEASSSATSRSRRWTSRSRRRSSTCSKTCKRSSA